jgi:RNA polymerase sigma factor FliA
MNDFKSVATATVAAKLNLVDRPARARSSVGPPRRRGVGRALSRAVSTSAPGPPSSTAPRTPALSGAADMATKSAAWIDTRNRVTLQHLDLVKAIAIALSKNLPSHIEVDDLVQAGTLGLVDAAAKYDAQKNIPFPAYAKYRIRGAILDHLRELDTASRGLRQRHKDIATVTEGLTARFGRAPTEEEVAEKLGVKLEQLRKSILELCNVTQVSSTVEASEGEDVTRDYPCAVAEHPDRIARGAELRVVLGSAIAELPKRHQEVVGLYHELGLTMAEIAQRVGVNESRVSQIHAGALAKIGSTLRARGIDSSRAFLD